ncbi:hypothetical protein H310_03775 [Aphanomyces invadans]|uniref:Cleavage/polyadenylation specificity factor A subunit C-terminal domain-containing protein n=1 Tax=Aphanomyces invadans TaxID=157072 RepID=A0A024UE49_9STRA|nr:hypothetical protein H310_03775 [Aphanomyces invadans]ETW04544.1 hypothetical protein H310_03775 [Aphanomyces invadans]|eukprot:XP_008865982.1 hypothetical protein H310_03775 [Aphanomyces invadans]
MPHSQHFLCHRDVVQSTGVLFSLFGSFCSVNSSDLVVVFAQRIDVYRVEPVTRSSPTSSSNITLHLLHTFPLSGIVECAQLVHVKKAAACLALTFAAAKLVLVRYQGGSLVTVAMHNFEEDGMGLGTALQGERFGRTQFSGISSIPLTMADPDHRCLSMLLYQDQLVVVPLQDSRHDPTDDDEEAMYQIASLKMEDKTRTEQYASTLASFGLDGVVGRTFMLRLKELDIRGKIIDFAFLEGYLEPTLMLLHEENDRQATVGRFAAGFDTCCLTVLSINLTTRLHPKIWSIGNLPSDCFKVSPCPAPLGGAIVLSQNAILYFNQNQYFGLSTTAFADKTIDSTRFPLYPSPLLPPDDKFLLTNCRTCLLNADEMLLNVSGQLFVLSLPSHRSLKQKGYYGQEVCQLMLRRMSTSQLIPATSMAVNFEKRLIFFGTRNGDSQLFRYHTSGDDHGTDAPTVATTPACPVPVPDDLDSDGEDMYLYGRVLAAPETTQENDVSQPVEATVEFADISLEVVDHLAAIGQVTAMDMGVDVDLEGDVPKDALVLSGGVGAQSSVSVINRGIRPVVITEVPLEGCRAIWAVYGSASATHHGYLILSMKSRTMVLKAGDETLPLESSGLFVEGPTLAASNILNNQRIVQVYKQGVRLLEESNETLECTQEIPLEGDIDCGGLGVDGPVGIVSVDILDPYVLLLLSDGSLRVVCADMNDLDLSVIHPDLDGSQGQQICCLCLFHDWGHIFSQPPPEDDTPATQEPDVEADHDDDDDIDGLYKVASAEKQAAEKSTRLLPQDSTGAPVYCAVCLDNGTMVVYCLPDFTVQAVFPGLNVAPQVLVNTKLTSLQYPLVGLAQDGKKPAMLSPVADICIHRVGPSDSTGNGNVVSKMVLVVYVANGDLILYQADGSRFVRRATQSITRPFVLKKESSFAQLNTTLFRYPMLTKFHSVMNHSGVFFRGASPMWIWNSRGLPALSPMAVPLSKKNQVPVLCLTAFHHWNCPEGFVYFHSDGMLRVCEVPPRATITQNGCTVQKVPFGCTIHHLVHIGCHGTGAVQDALQTPTYAVVVSTAAPPPVDDGTENDAEADAEEDGYTAPKPGEVLNGMEAGDFAGVLDEQYELRLVQSVDGHLSKDSVFSIQMERYEVVLTIKVMYLSDAPVLVPQEWKQKRKPYVVVGTGVVGPNGEDENGKGRLLVYEVDYAQYTSAHGVTGRKLPKLKQVYAKDHKQGGISMVSQLGAYVLAAVGSKLIVYELKGGQLVGCAFFDAQLYIVSLNVIKSFILYGDIYKSVHFLHWKPQEKSIIMLAKDTEPLDITATEVSVMNSQLGLIACDLQSNVHVLQYEPTHVESRGGQKLLRTSDFHLGTRVTSLLRKRVLDCPFPLYVTLLATAEGGVGVLIPVQERLFRRMYTLQSIMVNVLPQNAGLNPREFRQALHTRSTGRPDAWCTWKAKKAFLDFSVIGRFSDLDYVAQRELARCIGTTPEVVLHNLLELQRTTLFL